MSIGAHAQHLKTFGAAHVMMVHFCCFFECLISFVVLRSCTALSWQTSTLLSVFSAWLEMDTNPVHPDSLYISFVQASFVHTL